MRRPEPSARVARAFASVLLGASDARCREGTQPAPRAVSPSGARRGSADERRESAGDPPGASGQHSSRFRVRRPSDHRERGRRNRKRAWCWREGTSILARNGDRAHAREPHARNGRSRATRRAAAASGAGRGVHSKKRASLATRQATRSDIPRPTVGTAPSTGRPQRVPALTPRASSTRIARSTLGGPWHCRGCAHPVASHRRPVSKAGSLPTGPGQSARTAEAHPE
jgi:hypothetical protein